MSEANALLPLFHSAKAKAFRADARVTFFACAKKVTKESTPCLRALRALREGFAEPAGIFVSRILRLRKRRTSLCAAPCGDLPTVSATAEGTKQQNNGTSGMR